MQPQISVQIEPTWENVHAIRASVLDRLADHSVETRAAAAMAASELVGNAVKYGNPQPIQFTLRADANGLRITVTNGCTDAEEVRRLAAYTRQLQSADGEEALFRERLEHLLCDPCQSPGLGLYRTAFEGHFKLEYRYDDNVVTVTATRSIR